MLATAVTALATSSSRSYRNSVIRARERGRAYLVGGGDFDTDREQFVVDENRNQLFRVEVENHGSTPAFLVGFDVKFDTLARCGIN